MARCLARWARKGRLTGFEGDVIIASDNYPTSKSDVGCIDGVGTVGVQIRASVSVGAVDIDVLQENFARVYKRHRPHLGLKEIDPLDDRVGKASEGDLVWASWLVADIAVAVVPDLAVAIEGSNTFAVYMDLVAAKDEGCRLVLVSHRHRVFKPVRDVSAP